MFLAALTSRSWCAPHAGQSHDRTDSGRASSLCPQAEQVVARPALDPLHRAVDAQLGVNRQEQVHMVWHDLHLDDLKTEFIGDRPRDLLEAIVEYIIVILAVVVIGGGLMGFGNQVSGQIGITGNSISSWFGKANGAGDNASGGNGSGGGNNAGGENKGDENSGSQLQAPTVSVTGMDVVGERVTAKVSNLPEGATRVSYQWQYSPTKTGTFSDIEYGGNKNSYEISEEDEYYYLRCKVTTSSSKGKVPDAYSETIGEVYVFD